MGRPALFRVPVVVAACAALVALACRESTAPESIDEPPPGQVVWSDVSVGEYSSCALATTGRVYCWGVNLVPPCTFGDCFQQSRPTYVPSSPDFVSVAVGRGQSCGIDRDDAQVRCWGKVYGTTLGDGITTESPWPVLVRLPAPAAKISAGQDGSCALDVAGVVYCWGTPPSLVIPAGAGTSDTPLPLATPLRFTAISGGGSHGCAIDTNRDAYCWGGYNGSLGIGGADTSCLSGYGFLTSCTFTASPLRVVGGLKWADIASGRGFSCGVTVDGAGYCWGDLWSDQNRTGSEGVLGTGVLGGSKSPVAVSGGYVFRTIRAGSTHACGVTVDGAAHCWGMNDFGQLGIGYADVGPANSPSLRHPAPEGVVGGLAFRSLSAGRVSCAVSAAGNLYCWGDASGGALGNGEATGYRAAPTRVLPPE